MRREWQSRHRMPSRAAKRDHDRVSIYRQRFADTHIRINLDMLKTRHRERILLEACLAAKQSFVVDNTNVTVEARSKYIALAKAARFRVVGYYFRSSLADALPRNRQRAGRKAIAEKAIAATYRRGDD